jgi:hypothetical protein
MKSFIQTIFAIITMATVTISCNNSSDENSIETPYNELQNLKPIKEISNNKHIIELYSTNGQLAQGYQEIQLRIKDKTSGQYINNAEIQWLPIMHMTTMTHSCPKSLVSKNAGNNNLYSGYIVFTMAQNASEYWDLTLNYSVNGNNYTATSVLDIPASTKRVVTSFKGTDNVKYILAFIDPKNPKIATNDLSVGVWKMVDMNNFSVVDGYKVKIDPRMPSMGNHTSPNNVHATQNNVGGFYYGKLSLTMSGYWKINLQLENSSGTLLKGEEITDSNPASSIFFELEF